jgi:hypothetical protein
VPNENFQNLSSTKKDQNDLCLRPIMIGGMVYKRINISLSEWRFDGLAVEAV